MFVGYSLSDGSNNPPLFISYNQDTSSLYIDWVSLLLVCLFVCLFIYCYYLVTGITKHRTKRYPH